jgi:hypothetical protein
LYHEKLVPLSERSDVVTQALCMNCGNVKFGAICPCPQCGVASTGDMGLDIAFSDHHLAFETLQELGEVVRAIRRTCESAGVADEVRFWSFIGYVSANHPSILTATPEPPIAEQVRDVLGRTRLPPVTLRPGLRGPRAEKGNGAGGRRWWQFWKSGGGSS